jgi:hypothetical protein
VNPATVSRAKVAPALNPDYKHTKGDLTVDTNGYLPNPNRKAFAQRRDINCQDVGLPANSVACRRKDWGDDVKPVARIHEAPAHAPHYYDGEYAGHVAATKEGFILPAEIPQDAPVVIKPEKKEAEEKVDEAAKKADETKKETEAVAKKQEVEAAVKEEEKKAEKAAEEPKKEEKKAAPKKEEAKEAAPKEETKAAPEDVKEAAKFIYIARALPNGDFIYQRPDIACRDGQGANSVGSTVCSVVKEAVDVKPWVRTGPAPDHQPQYYSGNEGDVASNPDGTLTTSGLLPKTQAGTFLTRRRKVDPIAPSQYDPWVYDFSKFHMPS